MDSLLQYVLELFNNEEAAAQFVNNPETALASAGLSGVTPEQLQSAAASVSPGLSLDGGNPIGGLQQAVSDQFGFAPIVDSAASLGGGIEGGVESGLGVGADLGAGFEAGLA